MRRALALLGLFVSACDASPEAAELDASPDPADAAAPPVDAPPAMPITCGELPGPPLDEGVIETEPGFAEELAALDLAVVPDPLDLSGEGPMARAMVSFMLGRIGATAVTRADVEAAGPLGTVVLGAAAVSGDGSIDLRFLRRGLHHFYACSRPFPATLAELAAAYGDPATWPERTIECSRPKDGPRRLRENPERGVFVAETIDADGSVRETEVLFFDLRDDGQVDFAAYTREGALTDRSTFATSTSSVTTAAPFTCMTCHMDRDAGAFSLLVPMDVGAGCK